MPKKVNLYLVIICFVSIFFIKADEIGASRGKVIQLHTASGEAFDLYEGSYALVIGNDNYDSPEWGNLDNAVQDAEEVATALKSHGFDEVRVEKNLTAQGFREVFIRFFNEYGSDERNRLLFYYAGHGFAKKDPNLERMIGYLVMTDTPTPKENRDGFDLKSIELEWIENRAETMNAHHVLFMFDSCFSGSIFDAMRGQSVIPESVSDSTRHRVRQFISAGRSGESVPDDSIFKTVFLQLLAGEYEEAAEDGYLTGSEIGHYLFREVVDISRGGQHPQYGKSRNQKLNKGDFVFVVNGGMRGRGLPESSSCLDIQTKYPPVFPHCLKNTLPTENYPYWFFVEMANYCSEDILFDISFDLVDGPGTINNKNLPYTVKSGSELAQTVPLPISFTKPNIDDILIISWTIHKSTDKTLIRQGTATIEILPKDRYCWNLLRHDGKSVSQDFILASLTAWGQAGDSQLKKLAKEIVRGIGRKGVAVDYAQNWMKDCYSLFEGNDGITVTPMKMIFPPRNCMNIYTPMRVLEEKYADPLEASLFIASLAKWANVYKRFGVNLGMFIFSEKDANSFSQKYFLAWTMDDLSWTAIDVQQVNDLEFEENIKEATGYLYDRLNERNDLLSAIRHKGVFIDPDTHTFAFDFVKAARNYRIKRLP